MTPERLKAAAAAAGQVHFLEKALKGVEDSAAYRPPADNSGSFALPFAVSAGARARIYELAQADLAEQLQAAKRRFADI